jgi:sugar phosphate permease
VPGLLADNGMSRTELGSWFSGACIVAAAAQPAFGRLHDRLGGRVCIPAALLALALALFGLAASHGPAGVFLSLIVRPHATHPNVPRVVPSTTADAHARALTRTHAGARRGCARWGWARWTRSAQTR